MNNHTSAPRAPVAFTFITAGTAAVTLALTANALGLAASPAPGVYRSVLLLAGCVLLVGALAISSSRVPQHATTGTDITSLFSCAIADGVMLYAITTTVLIAAYGNTKPIERLG